MKRFGWISGFGLVLLAAALGIAGQIFWQFLSAGVGLMILGIMPFVDDRPERSQWALAIAVLTLISGLSIIAGTIGGGGL